MVRTSILRLAVSIAAVVLSIANTPTCEARPSPFEKLDGADRVDLLDATLDKTFLQRNLQEATTPTPAPGDLSTIPMLTSMAPTAAPTAAETSGAMGMVQAAASLATAATTVLMATAVIA